MMYDETGQMLLGRKPLSLDATVVEFVCWDTERSLPIFERQHHEPSGESMRIRLGPVEWLYVIPSCDDDGYFVNSRGDRKGVADLAETLDIAESASWATALIRSGDIECPQTREELLELKAHTVWGEKFANAVSSAGANIG
jgi:hypothetical protein